MMSRRRLLPLVLLAAALVTACASGDPVPATKGVTNRNVRRTALAELEVDNRTPVRLSVAFRPLGPAEAEVVVGRVEPRSVARMAPVLGGEPIVLIARADDGSEVRLAPRSLPIGQTWTWVIPTDTDFRHTDGGTQ